VTENNAKLSTLLYTSYCASLLLKKPSDATDKKIVSVNPYFFLFEMVVVETDDMRDRENSSGGKLELANDEKGK